MNRSLFFVLPLVSVLVLSTACRCVTCDDDDAPIDSSIVAPWSDAGLDLLGQIIGVHATTSELFVFSPTEFVRALPDTPALQLIEKRQFATGLRTLGQPAPHPLAFVRAALETATSKQFIEFQNVQNAAAVVRFDVDSLAGEPLALETKGETVGAFDRDGRVYLQPAIRRDTRSLALLIFSLDYSLDFRDFTELAYRGLVDVPGVLEDDAIVQSLQFIDGFFYLATKTGGYRITDGGIVTEVIPASTFVKDFFEYDGDYYASVAGLAEVLVSPDGETFERSGFPQRLGFTRAYGDRLVTQELAGWTFATTSSLARTPDSLRLNASFPRNNATYFGLDRLQETFYLGVDRTVYRSAMLEAVE